MAGIGAEEDVRPVIRGNRCFKNKLAGIGCRLHAKPETKNICRENAAAGIGVECAEAPSLAMCKSNHAAGIGVRAGGSAVIRDNQLINNALVAVGIRNRSGHAYRQYAATRRGHATFDGCGAIGSGIGK